MKSALDGVRVIDFTHFVAGPWATSMLGDYGADVIKIEKPGAGDGSRYLDHEFGRGLSSYFVGMNRSKRCLALDLSVPESRAVIDRLLETADVIIANFRPGVMERLGLGYETLHARYKRLIHVSITAYGEDGPLAKKPAMDIIVQAQGGVMGLTGEPGRPPVRVGAPVADFVGAYLALSAVLLGLYVRDTQGIAQQIKVNLLDGQISMLANALTGYARTGSPEGPQGSGHPQIVPYQVFETSDLPIVVGCLTEAFWRSFAAAIGCVELTADPRFATNADRVVNRAALLSVISPVMARQGHANWLQRLEKAGVPCAGVNNLRQIIDSEQVRQNGMIEAVHHAEHGVMTLVGNPLHLCSTPPRPHSHAPRLGEHSTEILKDLGFEQDDIERILDPAPPERDAAKQG